MEQLRYRISASVFTGLYYATLLGGEFSNCHGQGATEEEAIMSLKIRIYQLRAKAAKEKNEADAVAAKKKVSTGEVLTYQELATLTGYNRRHSGNYGPAEKQILQVDSRSHLSFVSP
jgi:hypothetical protein